MDTAYSLKRIGAAGKDFACFRVYKEGGAFCSVGDGGVVIIFVPPQEPYTQFAAECAVLFHARKRFLLCLYKDGQSLFC